MNKKPRYFFLAGFFAAAKAAADFFVVADAAAIFLPGPLLPGFFFRTVTEVVASETLPEASRAHTVIV